MNNKARLWVVEMLCLGRWEPTVGVRMSREDGREELAQWRRDNPLDHFRLVSYRLEYSGFDVVRG
jgi:hypothetical protein